MADARPALPPLPELLAFVHRLCDVSARIVRKAQSGNVSVTHKDDATPVTETDTRIEHALRKEIAKNFPDHGIVGEEYGSTEGNSPYAWIIDPIDGTLSFITGRPNYGTLICFSAYGTPHVGALNQPDLKRRWVGVTGGEAVCNGSLLRTSSVKDVDKAIIATTSPDYFSPEEFAAFSRVRSETKYAVYGGNCLDYAMLAQGKIDLVVEAGLKPYDVAALMPIVSAAGGTITDWSGRGINLSDTRINVIAAANHVLHEKAMMALQDKATKASL
ncbi:MAG: inositol monophosphatase family protein [Rickettsiales bacterium]